MDFRAPVIEINRTPAAVFGTLRVVGFVEIYAVEFAQAVRVFAEVAGHPIHYHAYSVLVSGLDEVAEIVRFAVAARHCVIARRLIAPRIIQRVFGQRHELDVRVVHFHDVFNQLVGQLAVSQITSVLALPRARVHFVNQHGVRVGRMFLFELLPLAVLPIVAFKVVNPRRGLRTLLRPKAVGIIFQNVRTVRRKDCVFVEVALLESLNKNFPSFAVLQLNHSVDAIVPVVEVADDADGFCMRSPHREAHALFTVAFDEVCAEHFISAIVRALVEQIKTVLTEVGSFHEPAPSR